MKKAYYLLLAVVAFACNDKKESKTEEKKSVEKVTNDSLLKKQSSEPHTDFSKEEQNLLALHNQIEMAMGNLRNDSLVYELSKKFTDSLTYLIKNNSSTLHYPFEKLQKENAIKMATSADKKLRVYSWDTNSGGSMRFFNQMYQFNANGTIKVNVSLASNDAQAYFSKIYTVQNETNENIYLVISNSILSGKYSVQHINAYQIKNSKLVKSPIFKTKTQTLDKIHVEYDFFSVVDRPERPVELITFNNNTLKIALIDDKQQVTNKNLIYEFNGTHFIYKGTK